MSDLKVYGFAPSTYVRSVRIALEEKAVSYELAPLEFHGASHYEMHPFGKMPILEHDGLVVGETLAILDYIDAAFDGPRLFPADARARPRTMEWASYAVDYFYPTLVRRLLAQRVFVPAQGGAADEAIIADAATEFAGQVKVVDGALAAASHLAGADMTAADVMLAPMFLAAGAAPEVRSVLEALPRIGAWLDRLSDLPSFEATDPTG